MTEESDPFFSVGVAQPPFRPCDLQLWIDDGSVHMDFVFDTEDTRGGSRGAVSLRLCRMSFDGFGCWCAEGSGNKIGRMDQDDADVLIRLASSETALLSANKYKLRNAMVLAASVIRKYLTQNKGHLWEDALIKHNLI